MNEGETVVVSKSHRALRAVNTLTLLGGIGLLTLSVWPGFVIGCFLSLAYPAIALLGLAWLLIVIRAVPKPYGRGTPIPLLQILIAPIMVCSTYALLKFYIPRRIAFVAHISQFEQRLTSAATTTQPIALNRWLGIYRVDQIRHDIRGGVYFRTGIGADGIDQMSCGFVHQPNPEGSPFGRKYYIYRPLAGDWYWFEASDDYY